MPPPLEGIRVLDLSRILTGPFCTMILGDLGAEVIKVEMPGRGDDTRSWGPPFLDGEAAYFLSVNRNKKSITVNLKAEKGREIVYKLAEKSDVLIENFSPGVTERLRIDYKTISRINPKIVYCSITGFGQTGPYRSRVAYDIILQGMGGFMGITGEPDRPPVRIGVAITDLIAGMYAAIAILSALRARDQTGRGQYIDIALLDSTVSFMTYMAANYFATGEVPPRMGSAHPNIVPYQCFKAGDGKYFTLAVANDRIWQSFCKAVGLEHLAEDTRFKTNPDRVRNRSQLIPMLEKLFLEKPRDEWLKILEENRVPAGPVYTMDEVFSDPQVLHREMLIEMSHPKIGKIKQIGTPMKLSETHCEIKLPPPLLGQHTEEVLKDLLGYTQEEIKQLREQGVI